jgi:CO/xanthine dehydrogenase Mo-binding subunit
LGARCLRKMYGAGEVPIVAADGSGANAINNAIGVRMRDEPMSPPRLCAAIDQQEPVRRAAE